MLKIKAALFAPYPFWLIILLAGAGPMILMAGISREMLIPAGIVSLALQIFVFGRIVAQVLPERVRSFWGILKEYWAPYLVAGILVAVVTMALGLGLSKVMSPPIPYRVVFGMAQGFMSAVTIYVWPLVFLRKAGVAGLLTGLSALKGSLVASLWIIGIVVVDQFVLTSGQMAYLEGRNGLGFAAMLLASVGHIYLAAAVFAGALYRLLGTRIVGPAVEA